MKDFEWIVLDEMGEINWNKIEVSILGIKFPLPEVDVAIIEGKAIIHPSIKEIHCTIRITKFSFNRLSRFSNRKKINKRKIKRSKKSLVKYHY